MDIDLHVKDNTIDSHVKDNTVKVLEENSREYLHGMEVDKDFLGSTQKH